VVFFSTHEGTNAVSVPYSLKLPYRLDGSVWTREADK
jgi:hypothetical protein